MNIWQALSLGIIQGVTEFLPVSSSGHLAIFQHWFALQEPLLFFDVFLHFASLLAIVIFFWPAIKKLNLKDYWFLAVSMIPAAIVGLLFENAIEAVFTLPLLVGLALMVTGLINARSQHLLKNPPPVTKELDAKKAFLIGIFQSFALLPGISRSGSTLLGGFTHGLGKDKAFTFAFLLGIPAILAASGLQVLRVVTENQPIPAWSMLVAGGGGALLASLLSLGLMKKMIDQTKFNFFSWYCLLIGAGVTISQLIR